MATASLILISLSFHLKVIAFKSEVSSSIAVVISFAFSDFKFFSVIEVRG